MNSHFAPGREFSLIEGLFDESHFSKSGEGLGDDGYLLHAKGEETWAISTDCSVEGIHYRLNWTKPEEALRKALLANLSDINAMGGKTALAFFNLGALKSWTEEQVARLRDTLNDMETEHGFRVAGGDTVRKDAESFFAFTVLGRVEGRPLLRSQARPGHRVYLSGRLGDSAAGLSLLSGGLRPGGLPELEAYFQAHFRPVPPLGLGPILARCAGAGAAIDISDGLSSELWHLSRQSNCRLRIDWNKLPFCPGLTAIPGGEAWRDWVLHGGEGYQLLFTGNFSDAELRTLAGATDLHEIGRVEAGSGVDIRDEAGAEKELEARGWSH